MRKLKRVEKLFICYCCADTSFMCYEYERDIADELNRLGYVEFIRILDDGSFEAKLTKKGNKIFNKMKEEKTIV